MTRGCTGVRVSRGGGVGSRPPPGHKAAGLLPIWWPGSARRAATLVGCSAVHLVLLSVVEIEATGSLSAEPPDQPAIQVTLERPPPPPPPPVPPPPPKASKPPPV